MAITIFCAFSVIISYVLNRVLLKFSSNLGIRNNQVSIVRWNAASKPALGGISFFLLFLFATIFYFVFDSSNETSSQIIGIVLASTLGFVMGWADDAYNTNPLLKSGAQLACAFILIASGIYIQMFDNEILNYILTTFWVVGIMNSVNMLDNMDGITTSVSAVIITGGLLFCLAFNIGSYFLIISMVGVLLSLITFLFFNWYPSKMFMGDAGSQFLGVFLSIIGIQVFWNLPQEINLEREYGFLMIFLIFLIPITDTTTVTINRLLKRTSPFVGGKDHTTHHLCYFGLNETKVALTFIFFSIFSLASSFYIMLGEIFAAKVTLTILNLGVSIWLYSLTRIKRDEKIVSEKSNIRSIKTETDVSKVRNGVQTKRQILVKES